jgi:ATP phosphoribosyltransferase regulatory subunit
VTDRNRWLLPEGIAEVLPAEAAALERMRRALIDLYASWGYELVLTPFIEYLESLLTGTGRDLDLQTFKLTDQLTGRLMGLRADMTPQVARIDAHSLRREGPVRLCYLGTVLHTRPDGFARSRSPFQVGAELYGHAGVESDAEVLCLMLETLRVTGVREMHVDLGHVGVYRSLARAAGLDDEQEQTLFEALQRKAAPEVEGLLRDWSLPAVSHERLVALTELNGGPEALGEAERVLAGSGEAVAGCLADLRRLAALVAARVPDTPLYFDLAELRGYRYQTGVVFAAFVPEHGQEVARGGRYDEIGRVFGRARPATGFSADLKTLIALGEAPAPAGGRGGVLAPWSEDGSLQTAVRELRARGERVVQSLPGALEAPGELGCTHRLVGRAGRWELEPIGLGEGGR